MIGQKTLAPLSQPIGSKAKTNCDLLARVFTRLAQVCFELFALSSDWFIELSVPVAICQRNCFGFDSLI